jgi:uncharacterized protein (TIGR03435 family)
MIRPEPGGQRYVVRNASLLLMKQLVYHIASTQIASAPGWMDTELFDVDAKAERPATLDQLHEMFRNMLADRFVLKFHRVTKELPAYVLKLGKAGAKLQQSESQEPYNIPLNPGPRGLVGTRVSMEHLSWYLSTQIGMPVVDRTGLTGYYDFVIHTPATMEHHADMSISGEEPGVVLKVCEHLGQLD